MGLPFSPHGLGAAVALGPGEKWGVEPTPSCPSWLFLGALHKAPGSVPEEGVVK